MSQLFAYKSHGKDGAKLENGKTIVVTVKLTVTESAELDRCVSVGGYDSRSNAIRVGLGEIFKKHGMLHQTDMQIEKERRIHRPRFGRPAKPTKIVPPKAKKKGDPSKMSAVRRRKSSV